MRAAPGGGELGHEHQQRYMNSRKMKALFTHFKRMDEWLGRQVKKGGNNCVWMWTDVDEKKNKKKK